MRIAEAQGCTLLECLERNNTIEYQMWLKLFDMQLPRDKQRAAAQKMTLEEATAASKQRWASRINSAGGRFRVRSKDGG